MFSRDSWEEIFATIRKNKLRTFLTSFSVAWGIFMFIILLGSGTGIRNGVIDEFKDDANNSIWLFSGRTSMPHKGLKPGRSIQFTNDEYDRTKKMDEVDHISSRYGVWGATVNQGKEYGNYSIRSTHPGHQYLENTIITKGRFLNELDLEDRKKVIVISELIQKDLFPETNDAMGKYLNVNGIPFKVVGIYIDEGSESEMRILYIPITTGQTVFNGSNKIDQYMFTVGDATLEESKAIAEEVRQDLARVHNFNPEDQRAVFVRNLMENMKTYTDLLDNIRIFIWVIGIGTILAGIVGVSNIMLIVVKERTKEIGIKKAIGATPANIIGQIILEAIFITSIAGYVGLVCGVFVLQLMAENIKGVDFFQNPEVDFGVAITSTLILILAGVFAGLFPATRAASINPVIALREE
jgi:putative ABC transport system permease protein